MSDIVKQRPAKQTILPKQTILTKECCEMALWFVGKFRKAFLDLKIIY